MTFAFKPSVNSELNYTFRMGYLNNIYQRTNRFRLDNYWVSQHILTYKNKSLILRGYMTTENTGDSYNIRSMAENIDRSFKSDNIWFTDFTNEYNAQNKGV